MRHQNGVYSLTTKVLEIGTAGIAAQGLWDLARPHMMALVARTNESSSMAQLDGGDIVYTARVPVPKIIALAVSIGTRFPAPATSMGRVLLADLEPDVLDKVLDTPSRSGIVPRVVLTRTELDDSPAVSGSEDGRCPMSCCPTACGRWRPRSGTPTARTVVALNVTVHAAETSIETLTEEYLPLLLDTAAAVSDEWSHLALLPTATVDQK